VAKISVASRGKTVSGGKGGEGVNVALRGPL